MFLIATLLSTVSCSIFNLELYTHKTATIPIQDISQITSIDASTHTFSDQQDEDFLIAYSYANSTTYLHTFKRPFGHFSIYPTVSHHHSHNFLAPPNPSTWVTVPGRPPTSPTVTVSTDTNGFVVGMFRCANYHQSVHHSSQCYCTYIRGLCRMNIIHSVEPRELQINGVVGNSLSHTFTLHSQNCLPPSISASDVRIHHIFGSFGNLVDVNKDGTLDIVLGAFVLVPSPDLRNSGCSVTWEHGFPSSTCSLQLRVHLLKSDYTTLSTITVPHRNWQCPTDGTVYSCHSAFRMLNSNTKPDLILTCKLNDGNHFSMIGYDWDENGPESWMDNVELPFTELGIPKDSLYTQSVVNFVPGTSPVYKYIPTPPFMLVSYSEGLLKYSFWWREDSWTPEL
ncbi:hypothetical protein RCL1_005339 [Eukaryota sp. TZLM3-RCL]